MLDEPGEAAVTCTVDAGVATVMLNRPLASNALNLAMAHALRDIFRGLAGDDDVRVVLLGGQGRLFSAGGDVKAMAAAKDREAFIYELASASHEAIVAITDLDRPVVAKVQGAVAGAGLALVLASDIVLAGQSTRFLTAFAGVGLSPDSGTSWLLPKVVGQRRALELLLTGRILSADEAVNWGIATRVCPDAELSEQAAAVAAQLAAGAAPALGAARLLVRSSPEHSLRDHLELEAKTIASMSASAESRALVDAFALGQSQ